MVLAEMLNRLLANATGQDDKEPWKHYDKGYADRIEEINNYISAKFGSLDVSEIMKK